MKVLREIVDETKEGLLALMGEKVLIFCPNYIYFGKLVGVNEQCVKLEGAKIVYETGAFDAPALKDAQCLPSKFWYIATPLIESFGCYPR